MHSARLTSNVVRGFCVRELSETHRKAGRNPSENYPGVIRFYPVNVSVTPTTY
jgi:hypothetical protein